MGTWGASQPNPGVPLLSLGAHVTGSPWEALWPWVTGSPFLARLALLAVPAGGAVLPRGSRGTPWARHRLWPWLLRSWSLGALGTSRAGGAPSTRLPFLSLQATLSPALPGAPRDRLG